LALHPWAGRNGQDRPADTLTRSRDDFQKTGILIMSTAPAIQSNNQYIVSWNPYSLQSQQWRHILAGGLHCSAKVFPALPLHSGLDKRAGCRIRLGDTAIELARRVGPAGSVVGLDLHGGPSSTRAAPMRRTAELTQPDVLERMFKPIRFKPGDDSAFPGSNAVFRTSGSGCATCVGAPGRADR